MDNHPNFVLGDRVLIGCNSSHSHPERLNGDKKPDLLGYSPAVQASEGSTLWSKTMPFPARDAPRNSYFYTLTIDAPRIRIIRGSNIPCFALRPGKKRISRISIYQRPIS